MFMLKLKIIFLALDSLIRRQWELIIVRVLSVCIECCLLIYFGRVVIIYGESVYFLCAEGFYCLRCALICVCSWCAQRLISFVWFHSWFSSSFRLPSSCFRLRSSCFLECFQVHSKKKTRRFGKLGILRILRK